MPLEPNVEHIDDLVDTNPAFDDPVNQGDDHDRITKKGMQGNVTGDDTNTRLLSNFEIVAIVGPNFCELRPTVAGGPDIRLDLGDAGGTKTHGGLRSDGTDLLSLVNDALQGTVELVASEAAPGDRKLATFDPTLGFDLFRAGLLMLQGVASLLTLKAEDEAGVQFRLESEAGVPYLQLSGAPGSSQLIDALVEAQNLTLRAVATGGATRNLFTADPDGPASIYHAGTVKLQTLANGYTNGTATWTTGTGSPEGVITAGPGSIYSELTSGTAKPLWMKNFSAGNTGWLAVDFQP